MSALPGWLRKATIGRGSAVVWPNRIPAGRVSNEIVHPQTGLLSSWIAGPAIKVMVDFELSLKKYPPIAPGTPDPYKPPVR
jgi:hypothetical protein